jgi:alpha-tubulin suppressor-like RCC1 family protein
LGLGHNNTTYIPTLIPNITGIIKISSGYYSSILLDREGRIYTFGLNTLGQLGLDDFINRNTPILNPFINNIDEILVGSYFQNVVRLKNGSIFSFGNNYVNIFELI